MTTSRNVFLSVLLSESAEQSEAARKFSETALVAVRHPKIVKRSAAYRPTIVERLAARGAAKGC